MKESFDSKKYMDAQNEAFADALSRDSERPVFIEFGGKPFSDPHAERVLPGYESDSKAEILRETTKLAEVIMVVNALDILRRPDGRTLRGRIRGDTSLFYDQETIRLLEDAHKRKIPVTKAVMSVTPKLMSSENKRLVDRFRKQLKDVGVLLFTHYKVNKYPKGEIFNDRNPFVGNEKVRGGDKNLIAISPGGGSGKFGVILSEMYDALMDGETPDYVKFETFPIYQLDANHALNLAFEVATADLGNKVVDVGKRKGQIRTSYDKDIENFALLQQMFEVFGKSVHMSHMNDAVDMGINKIVKGITDMEKVVQACREEICRRIVRYESEVVNGIERMSTLQIARDVLGKFDRIYGIKIPRTA